MAKVEGASQARRGGAKPGERRGGRQKGTPNKITGEVKDMILGALAQAGGQQYLYEQSEANPTAFLTLVGKVLPLQLQGDPAAPITITVTRRVVD